MAIVNPSPDIPSSVDPKTAEYLRRLRVWMESELKNRSTDAEATPQIFLQASDTKAASIFKVTVDSSGALTAAAMPLGGGKP